MLISSGEAEFTAGEDGSIRRESEYPKEDAFHE
jgi:hypothetical protein